MTSHTLRDIVQGCPKTSQNAPWSLLCSLLALRTVRRNQVGTGLGHSLADSQLAVEAGIEVDTAVEVRSIVAEVADTVDSSPAQPPKRSHRVEIGFS